MKVSTGRMPISLTASLAVAKRLPISYIKQLSVEVEHDIMNSQCRGPRYLPLKLKAMANKTDTRFDNS